MSIKLLPGKEVTIKEGLARLIIPNPELYKRPNGKVEPAWMPVFYNPDAIISRDFTVLFLKSAFVDKDFFFVDALAGTGIRGIRIALEAGGKGILNDIDARAYYYMVKNIALNNLGEKVEAYNCEANTLLNTLALTGIYVDYVDIDPYGSPSPFLDSSLKPLGREAYLGVTATDIASLSCTYPHKTLSRYWNTCVKVDFEKELAARVLISNAVLRAAALEIGLNPLTTVVYKHYIRVFFSALRSSSKAHEIVKNCVGYLWYCQKTLERGFSKTLEEALEIKCLDGSKPAVLGRLWICNIEDPVTAEKLIKTSQKITWLISDTLKLLNVLKDESSINQPYYRLDKLCSALNVNMPRISVLLDKLRSLGIKCSRTHMDSRGVKIDAQHSELVEAIRSFS